MIEFIVRSLEQGLIFGILVLGVYLTYRVLDFPDLTVDGSFPLGAAVSARLIFAGVNPFISLICATLAGVIAGFCTGLLHTRFKISNLLSGILLMIALYSINLRVMGRANIPLLGKPTIFREFSAAMEKITLGNGELFYQLALLVVITIGVKLALDLLFKTRAGLTLRACGDNQQLAINLGVNPSVMILGGLALANGLAALSGAMVAQLQGFADAGMGIGTIITGLASVIIGQAIFKPGKHLKQTTAVIFGSILYRGAIRASLSLGLAPVDLKLITSILVIIALVLPQTRFKTGFITKFRTIFKFGFKTGATNR